MKLVEIVILLTMLLTLSSSRSYFYSPELKPTTFYTCYYSQTGSDRVMIDIRYNKTQMEDSNIINLYNALNAGLKVEAAIIPISDDINWEVEFMAKNNFKALKTVWIAMLGDVKKRPGLC